MDRGYSYYEEVRLGHSFLCPGHIRLGNWPRMLDNGPHLSPRDILSLGTFWPLVRFVLGRFVWGHFVWGRFVLYVYQRNVI